MQVVLRRDVDKLGRLGDVVDVAAGYARNYLLPKGIAVPVTDENLRQVAAARQARRQREQEELERVGRQAELLEGFLCYIPVRATDKGHLFGSVGPQQIADNLVESGFEGIRATNISLDGHIEQVGDYIIDVMLHPEVHANITVRIAAEQQED
jgi:large subunit ribosomal protein L9